MKKLGKLLFITSLLLCFLIPRGWTQTQAKNQPDSIELKLKEIYTKREVMIPMRDGIKLYTARVSKTKCERFNMNCAEN